MIAKHILNIAEKEHKINGIYVNCWEHSTLHSIMDNIINELRILGAEKISTVFKLERFTKFVENQPFLLVLDEMDQLMPKERNLILYNLCDIGRMGLICISVERKCIYDLDERVRSRLNPKLVMFPLYTPETLCLILSQRAEPALAPETWDKDIIDKICSMASGDARTAISTLRNASFLAENERSPFIRPSHLKQGWLDAREVKLKNIFNNLTIHHKIIYHIIKSQDSVMSGDLWKIFLSECKQRKLTPMAPRTFSLYINQLLSRNLIKWDRAGIRGNVRVFKIADSQAQRKSRNSLGDNLA